MIDMEYRAWIEVSRLDIESEESEWLLSALERLHGDLGPVMSGAGGGLHVILATDRGDRAEAASEMFDAVVDGLRACGLSDTYPTRVEVEPADELAPA